MNVRQLIEALNALDPDLPVMMPSRVQHAFCTVEQIILDVATLSKLGGLEFANYDDDGCFTVARLFEDGDHDDRDERPKPLAS